MISKHGRLARGVLALLGLVFAGLLFGAAEAAAQGRLGQYLVGRVRNDGGKVTNPTDREMYCVAFYFFDAGDTLETCVGEPIESKETNDDDILASPTSLGLTDNDAKNKYVEVLCVPSTGKGRGSIKGDGKGVGVLADYQGPNWLLTRPARMYELPEDSGLADDVVDCACDEMDTDGVNETLFKVFGFNCD